MDVRCIYGGYVVKKTYKLSDIFDLQMGKTPDRHNSKYWVDGENPWISIADLSSNGKFLKKTKESKRFK